MESDVTDDAFFSHSHPRCHLVRRHEERFDVGHRARVGVCGVHPREQCQRRLNIRVRPGLYLHKPRLASADCRSPGATRSISYPWSSLTSSHRMASSPVGGVVKVPVVVDTLSIRVVFASSLQVTCDRRPFPAACALPTERERRPGLLAPSPDPSPIRQLPPHGERVL